MKNIANYEKQLVKGLLTMYLAKGYELNSKTLVTDLFEFTDNGNSDHYWELIDYVEVQIKKLA